MIDPRELPEGWRPELSSEALRMLIHLLRSPEDWAVGNDAITHQTTGLAISIGEPSWISRGNDTLCVLPPHFEIARAIKEIINTALRPKMETLMVAMKLCCDDLVSEEEEAAVKMAQSAAWAAGFGALPQSHPQLTMSQVQKLLRGHTPIPSSNLSQQQTPTPAPNPWSTPPVGVRPTGSPIMPAKSPKPWWKVI